MAVGAHLLPVQPVLVIALDIVMLRDSLHLSLIRNSTEMMLFVPVVLVLAQVLMLVRVLLVLLPSGHPQPLTSEGALS